MTVQTIRAEGSAGRPKTSKIVEPWARNPEGQSNGNVTRVCPAASTTETVPVASCTMKMPACVLKAGSAGVKTKPESPAAIAAVPRTAFVAEPSVPPPGAGTAIRDHANVSAPRSERRRIDPRAPGAFMSVPTASDWTSSLPASIACCAAGDQPAIHPSGRRRSTWFIVWVAPCASGVPRFQVTICVVVPVAGFPADATGK